MLVREFWVGALRDLNARQNNTEATTVSPLAKIKTSIQFITFSSYLLGLVLEQFIRPIYLEFPFIFSINNYTSNRTFIYNVYFQEIGLDGRVVMQRPAKPFTPVRFRLQPPSC